jgi:hypothetical protein
MKSWKEAERDGDVVRSPDAGHPVCNYAEDEGPLWTTWDYALNRLAALGWDRERARAKLESGSTIGNVGNTSWTLEAAL